MIPPDVLVALPDDCPAVANLDPAAREALGRLLTAPFAVSYARPPKSRGYREHIETSLKRHRIPPATAPRSPTGSLPDSYRPTSPDTVFLRGSMCR